MEIQKIIKALKMGGLAVLPTDTLYGIHAQALNPEAVERIYKLRGRSENKPFIILISSIEDLEKFNIKLDTRTKDFLESIWPNSVSVVLPCEDAKFSYLHRNTNSLAFRIPKNNLLLEILKQTGPLVSTSVNPEGEKPAETIREAREYFKEGVDFYIDRGKLQSQASTVIKIENNKVTVLRLGAVQIKTQKI